MPQLTETEEKTKKERHWYAIRTYSGYEDAVMRYLKQRVESLEMQEKIFNIAVPTEKRIKIKNGRRHETEEKIYPGYVLVDMALDEDSWYVVRNTPRVTGFVGAESTRPTPLSEEEVESLLSKMNEKEATFKIEYVVGEVVRITDGPFKDHEGKIAEINEEQGRIKIQVPLFGRETALELDVLQVKKI